MNAFTLKIIALLTMFIDHVGAVIPEFVGFEPQGMNIFRVIGRVSFPIFVCLVAEGFRHTKSPMKYLARLGIFAILSEIPYDLAFNFQWWRFRQCGSTSTLFFPNSGIDFFANTNIFYTLFLGGAAIVTYQYIMDRLVKRDKEDVEGKAVVEDDFEMPSVGISLADMRKIATIVAVLPSIGFMLLAQVLTTDYGAYGVAFILIMYVTTIPNAKNIYRRRAKAANASTPFLATEEVNVSAFWYKLRLVVMAVLCVWQHNWLIDWIARGYLSYIPAIYLLMIPATLIPVVLFAFYNGNRGPSLKWLFYAAYPLHLLVLADIIWRFGNHRG
ncbi:MAG: conjugal transfer protein TraX [Defluviitaleaceae bacterium]|nr:conjugal transfer protein TraX [Defluviitaleaceae bacterium]